MSPLGGVVIGSSGGGREFVTETGTSASGLPAPAADLASGRRTVGGLSGPGHRVLESLAVSTGNPLRHRFHIKCAIAELSTDACSNPTVPFSRSRQSPISAGA